MTRRQETAALLALYQGRRKGWITLADEIEECGSALAVLERDLVTGQGDLLTLASDPVAERLATVEAQLSDWEAAGLQLVTLLEDEYPDQLRSVHQRPPFLFYRGRLDRNDSSGVAVVGTRNPSDAGMRRAQEIAGGLAEQGRTVVSGLATGIDTCAHRAALAAGGRTVAVIGTGLLRSYPAENADLQRQLAEEHLVLSQFWPDAPPTKSSFPLRNAVMSGYAAATVVVEAAWKSGARMQARLALEHGRPVFLLESLLEHDWARSYAERPGTTVVTDAQEVLDRLDQLQAVPGRLVWA